MNQNFDQLKTQHLFLLIGANPLPNYVAAMLLAQDGGTVYLLHTPGVTGTASFANNLQLAIQRDRPNVQVILREMDDSDSGDITQKVNAILETIRGTVGLNYTGGTKPMATHTYRAIERKFPDAIFTYLDPRELRIIVDSHRDVPVQSIPISNCVQLNLKDLVALHGYRLSDVRQAPKFFDLVAAIARLHSTPSGSAEWSAYLNSGQPAKASTGASLELRNITAMIADIGKSQCSNLLNGLWLEEYTLGELQKAAQEVGINDYAIDVKPTHRTRPSFQLDLAAIFGYQLFAISCQVAEKKQYNKEHLLEVFVRAQQLGGEEARFALVCCSSNPQLLQSEIEQDWDIQGKVRVFGRNQLFPLSDHLKDWFVTANKR